MQDDARSAMKITISPTSGSNSTAAGKGCATIFLSIFASAGLLFIVFLGKSAIETVRPYFWDRTSCVIDASSIRENGDRYEFDVRYTYRADGRTFTGTRFRMGMMSGLNGEAVQRAAFRYAAGSGAECYVNSSAPAESTLERGTPWSLLIMLFPLVFVGIGVGGIIAVWRAKPSYAKAVSERHRAIGSGLVLMRLFGLAFICVGGGVMYALLVHPMLKEAAAAQWMQVPCEIISSSVAHHSGSKSSTYSVEIRYRYDFKGRSYTGTRYNFDTGNSSSRGWRDEAVAKFPPKLKTLCYVNPEDPVEAVLSVKPSPDRWFGILPGVFLVIGLFIFFKAPAMATRGSISRTGTPTDTLPRMPRDPATGEVELRPAGTPLTGFIVMLIFALIWNGITWGILLSMPRHDLGLRIFLGVFAIIGAGLGAGVIYTFLAIFNPRPILTAGTGAVPLGGRLDLRWRFTGNARRIARLTITLEGREEATYRRGTTTTTDRNVFAILPLTETADRAEITGGSTQVTIPRELIHTFTAPNNKIVWTLRLAGDVPRWPDVSAEFPITVLPRDAATLFQEQTPAS